MSCSCQWIDCKTHKYFHIHVDTSLWIHSYRCAIWLFEIILIACLSAFNVFTLFARVFTLCKTFFSGSYCYGIIRVEMGRYNCIYFFKIFIKNKVFLNTGQRDQITLILCWYSLLSVTKHYYQTTWQCIYW